MKWLSRQLLICLIEFILVFQTTRGNVFMKYMYVLFNLRRCRGQYRLLSRFPLAD